MPTKLHLRDRLKRALHIDHQNRAGDTAGGFSPQLSNTAPLAPPTIAPGPVTNTTTTTTTTGAAVDHVLPTPSSTPPTTPPHVDAATTQPLQPVVSRSRSSTFTGAPLGAGLPGALYDEPDASEPDILSSLTQPSTPSLGDVAAARGVTPLPPPPLPHPSAPAVTVLSSQSVSHQEEDLEYESSSIPPDSGTLTPAIPVTNTLRGANAVLRVKDTAVDPTAGQDVAGLAHPGDWEVPVRVDGTRRDGDDGAAVVGVEKESHESRAVREAGEVLAEKLRRESEKRMMDEEEEEERGLLRPVSRVEVTPMRGSPKPVMLGAGDMRKVSVAGSSVYDDDDEVTRRAFPFDNDEDLLAPKPPTTHRASSYSAAAGLTSSPPPVPLNAHYVSTHTVESTQEPILSPSSSSFTSTSTSTSSITHTTHHTIRSAAPITIERILPIHTEIVSKQITREIHTSEIRPIIQPVLKTEYLPAQHIVVMPDGSRVEVTEEQARVNGWDEIGRTEVVVGRTRGLPDDDEVDGKEGRREEVDEKIEGAFARFGKGRKEDEGYAGVESGKVEGLGTGEERLVVMSSGKNREEELSGGMERLGLVSGGAAAESQREAEMIAMEEARRRRSVGVAV